MVNCSGFANGYSSPGTRAVCIRRTSNTGPWQGEQRANRDIGGQTEVGPTSRVIAKR
jgi:hypothetical protein